MNRVLVVTAVDVEARALARHLGLGRAEGRRPLRYRGTVLDVVCAGPGASRLGQFTALARTAALVVSAGTCGALAPALEVGDLVLAESVVGPDGRRRVLAELAGFAAAGTLLTVSAVVETAAAKARLWRETGASAIDMESAFIAEWAADLGVPAAAVRGVADAAARGIPAAFAALVDADGRTRTSRAARLLLTRRRALAEALVLRRDTARALRNVAATLRHLARPGGVDGIGPRPPSPPSPSGTPESFGAPGRHRARENRPAALDPGGGYRGGAAVAPPDL